MSLSLATLLVLGLTGAAFADETPAEAEHSSAHSAGASHDHGAHDDGHDHGGGHKTKHLENWFSLSFGEGKKYKNGPFAFMILNFVLLCWLLVKFTKKPVTQYLETRHDTIRDNLAEAAELRKQASAKLAEIENKLDNLKQEIASIKKGVAADAELEKKRIIEAAQTEADRIIQQADKTLDNDLKRARKMLEKEAADAAMTAAEKLIKEQINKKDLKRLNEEYFEQIASSGESN